MPYVLSLDLGTTSARALVYDEAGRRVAGVMGEAPGAPTPTADGGEVFDADDLVDRVVRCLEQALSAWHEPLMGVGFSCFWHSLVGVDDAGRAVTPVIPWSDTRSAPHVAQLRRELDGEAVHQRTGCVQHTSYWPAKLRLLRDRYPDQFQSVARWMSPAEYVYLRLFGSSACSVSMASGTGLYHHARGEWDAELLALLHVRPEQLNPIVDSNEASIGLRASYAQRLPALREVPWFPGLGDGACSNVGSGCIGPRRMAMMVGTSGALRLLSDREEGATPAGLWRYRLDRRRYLVGGALSNGGNLRDWLSATLRLPADEVLENRLRRGSGPNHGLTVLPFLRGERAPGWRGEARAVVAGLGATTAPEAIYQAFYEGMAYRFAEIYHRLAPLAEPDHSILASGKAPRDSRWLAQTLADVLGREIIVGEDPEASARGAALYALECLGAIASLQDVPALEGVVFGAHPVRHLEHRRARARHARLYAASRSWDG